MSHIIIIIPHRLPVTYPVVVENHSFQSGNHQSGNHPSSNYTDLTYSFHIISQLGQLLNKRCTLFRALFDTTPPAVQPRITSANAISSARSAGNELGPNNVSLWAGFMYTRSYTMLYTLRGSYAVSVFPCVGLVMFTNILHGSRLAEFKRGNRNPGRGWKWMNRETLETRKDIFFQSSESLQSSLIIPQTLKCSWVACFCCISARVGRCSTRPLGYTKPGMQRAIQKGAPSWPMDPMAP